MKMASAFHFYLNMSPVIFMRNDVTLAMSWQHYQNNQRSPASGLVIDFSCELTAGRETILQLEVNIWVLAHQSARTPKPAVQKLKVSYAFAEINTITNSPSFEESTDDYLKRSGIIYFFE